MQLKSGDRLTDSTGRVEKWWGGRSPQRAERMRTCDSSGSANPV